MKVADAQYYYEYDTDDDNYDTDCYGCYSYGAKETDSATGAVSIYKYIAICMHFSDWFLLDLLKEQPTISRKTMIMSEFWYPE